MNTQLGSCEFVLPAIKQAANQLRTLLDVEDGFQQLPLSECSRQYTAFCTPFGVFEWGLLSIGVKVGPQAFQRMMSNCLKSLQPHTLNYIDDLLTETLPKLFGKGKILYSNAYLEHHFQNVVQKF